MKALPSKKIDWSSPVPYALALDAATVFTGLFLMEAVSREFGFLFRKVLAAEETESAGLMSAILLAAFLAQMLGSYLKGKAAGAVDSVAAGAQETGAKQGRKWGRGIFFSVLVFLHLALAVLMSAKIAVLAAFVNQGGNGAAWAFCLLPVLPTVSTFLVAKALLRSPEKPETNRLKPPAREAVANLCLFSYALVCQFIGNFLLAEGKILLPPVAGWRDAAVRFGSGLLMLVPATMFFFAPRILFLKEEFENRATRIGLTLVLGSIFVRWVAAANDRFFT